MTKSLHITPRKIAILLCVTVFLLLLVNLFVVYFHFVRGHEYIRGFINGFYFDNEANFPSLYSSLAILLCSVLMWLISSSAVEKQQKRSMYWKFLAVIFVFLAADEFISIHECLFYPAQQLVKESALNSNYFHFAWFVPYSLLVLIAGLVLLGFFFKLQFRTRIFFIVAAVIFLSGAVGMEMVSGKYWAEQGWAIDHSGNVDLNYALMVTAEEFLEMLGVVVFIYALSGYYLNLIGEQFFNLRISRNERD